MRILPDMKIAQHIRVYKGEKELTMACAEVEINEFNAIAIVYEMNDLGQIKVDDNGECISNIVEDVTLLIGEDFNV